MKRYLTPKVRATQVRSQVQSLSQEDSLEKEMATHSSTLAWKIPWVDESATLIMPANLENSAVATGLEKVSFHSNPKERQCQRILNYRTIALISHASKVMHKILQARLQQYVNRDQLCAQAR